LADSLAITKQPENLYFFYRTVRRENRVRYFVSRREKPSGKDLEQESDKVRSISKEWKELIIERDVLYIEKQQ
jgi:hypothetical protein